MTEPFSPDGPLHLLTDLCRLAHERRPLEEEIVETFETRTKACEKGFADAMRNLTVGHQEEKGAVEAEFAARRDEELAGLDAEQAACQKEYDAARKSALVRFEQQKQDADAEMQNVHWEASAIAEAAQGGTRIQLKEVHGALDVRWRELQTIHQQAVDRLSRWGQWRDYADPRPAESLLERNPMQRFAHAGELARKQSRALHGLLLPRFFQGIRPLGLFFLLWVIVLVPTGAMVGWPQYQYWVPASGAGSVAIFAIVGGLFYSVTRRKCEEHYSALRRTLLEAGLDRPATLDAAKADCQRLFDAIGSRYSIEVTRASGRFASTMAELQRRKEQELAEIEAKYPPRLAVMAEARRDVLEQLKVKYPALLRDIDARFAATLEEIRTRHVHEMQEIRETYQRQWDEMALQWRTGLEQFTASIAEMRTRCGELFPDWHTRAWAQWEPPHDIPAAVSFGLADVKLDDILGGVPEDERLRPAQTEFTLPALLPFPKHTLFMFKATDDGRPKAVEGIQSVMLRLLTGLPAGKVRFTIFDPIGLGENFSAFMHLADYEELLVASRIWTDSEHLEQRLADLTEHMENVIQVYLRNEFASIQEYNASAGEMAEPYRVLVIANFPANFTETAAHRLKSIVASGARCGVFVLMSVDKRLPTPYRFNMADLETDAFVLEWNAGRFDWKHPDYGPVPIRLDPPPAAERFTEIVRAVGNAVKNAGRVEVPFRCIVPPESEWWTSDSRAGIDVPLGRSGAKKLQHLELGKGTSQHVLISGKTGSGKSTLLHVLITNLMLRYRPDEIELFLIDFKKGVEFKTYARHQIPHARVIAVESEREFGLSALQRLDAEMRTRGDTFRRLGVQDLKGFRNTQPGVHLTRILLIVDEFQELFTEDDRVAQESALLLDRLVRQGRAFGIHVLLGSQTLGGAYSLARSTIGQMAVRIALQCSEADAHLILSEDNTAARLLTRPGEAIYNDANGLYEGNHPFQIVWLSDEERDEYLERMHALAVRSNIKTVPPIVFEGNQPADPAENVALQKCLTAAVAEAPPSARAWLGSAVAIKDPTSAMFVRQSGSNLLVVGHREETSLGILANCFLGLAAQHPADKPDGGEPGARFYILDGTRPDAPEAGFWTRIAPTLPHQVTVADTRSVVKVLQELSAEVARRQAEGGERQWPPVYLFIYNFGRFRELRKEDDYGFGGFDENKPVSPGKLFATILRDGPLSGIHTLAWCDSCASVNRLLDRQGLRDFEMRVLFQMNATDSSSLMEAPDASRLGIHRAIFYDEGQGYSEKFRPYGVPTPEWLEWVAKQLRRE